MALNRNNTTFEAEQIFAENIYTQELTGTEG